MEPHYLKRFKFGIPIFCNSIIHYRYKKINIYLKIFTIPLPQKAFLTRQESLPD